MATSTLVLAAFVAGIVVGALLVRARLAQLRDAFAAVSAQALHDNNERFLALAATRLDEARSVAAGDLDSRRQAVEHLVAPLQDTLGRVEGQLRALELARADSAAALREQLATVAAQGTQLQAQTRALVSALSKPQTRGRWGELQLRRVVELAGMAERCDVTEQATVDAGDGAVLRPDLVVHLAGGKSVVVDSKVTLAAYLEAYEADDDAVRSARLDAHARHLRSHVDRLAAKAYWARLEATPEFVVLFVPGEAFLAPALERDPTLLEDALARRVHIATPTTLVSMLRTVAYAWQQEALADHAREVFELGRELYARLGQLGGHVDGLGKAIGRVVTQYNATVGSLETRALVSARRLHDLRVVDADLPAPRSLDALPRPVAAPELALDAERRGRAHRSRNPDPGGPLDDPRFGLEPVPEADEDPRRSAG